MQGDVKPLKPAIWIAQDENSGTIILQEGRYHQIRRMFTTIGNEVENLHRFRIGALELGDLPEGEYRFLQTEDLTALFDRG
jgi:16S rRNA pseudouridine516 synthase